MAISHCYWHLVVNNGIFILLLTFSVNNGNFTLLLTSSGQQWQFHTDTDTLWSRMAISHCYWHLVVKNGNFTLLLTSHGQEWQFHIATDIWWSRMAIGRYTLRSASRSAPQMHHGIYIMGCIWQPFWILQEKVGISCYFWIIMVINSQLALYSHVSCNPLNTPLKHPQNTPHLIISTMRSHICQV